MCFLVYTQAAGPTARDERRSCWLAGVSIFRDHAGPDVGSSNRTVVSRARLWVAQTLVPTGMCHGDCVRRLTEYETVTSLERFRGCTWTATSSSSVAFKSFYSRDPRGHLGLSRSREYHTGTNILFSMLSFSRTQGFSCALPCALYARGRSPQLTCVGCRHSPPPTAHSQAARKAWEGRRERVHAKP